MSTMQIDSPAIVIQRLDEIEHDLAVRQNALESAALNWFHAKRERERAAAVVFLGSVGTVAERRAVADRDTAIDGVDQEAEWEAIKAVVRVLETRASVLQSVLRAQGRA